MVVLNQNKSSPHYTMCGAISNCNDITCVLTRTNGYLLFDLIGLITQEEDDKFFFRMYIQNINQMWAKNYYTLQVCIQHITNNNNNNNKLKSDSSWDPHHFCTPLYFLHCQFAISKFSASVVAIVVSLLLGDFKNCMMKKVWVTEN